MKRNLTPGVLYVGKTDYRLFHETFRDRDYDARWLASFLRLPIVNDPL